jgi:hypothetical protein
MMYADQCAGCAISQGLRPVSGGLIKLPGDWVVSQYGGSEGFLGWLALQPRFHRMALSQLSDRELRYLGPNIKALDSVLSQYWHLQYPDDPVRRVYVVYFFESEFESPPPREAFHLHIHVIPRFQSLDTAERLRRTEHSASWVDGWRTPKLSPERVVPEAYAKDSAEWEARATTLIAYIHHELAGRP